MQNTTTHQIFTVSRCHSKVVRFLSLQRRRMNIIIDYLVIILNIVKSQRHRDTEILSIGVAILHYIKTGVQKLLITSDILEEA